jgi:hypothetical protein
MRTQPGSPSRSLTHDTASHQISQGSVQWDGYDHLMSLDLSGGEQDPTVQAVIRIARRQ